MAVSQHVCICMFVCIEGVMVRCIYRKSSESQVILSHCTLLHIQAKFHIASYLSVSSLSQAVGHTVSYKAVYVSV